MTFEFFTPAHIIVGAEALSKAAVHWRQKGKKALVVTDEMMVSLGNAARVTNALQQNGVACEVFSGINGEPTDVMVEAGLAAYQQNGCDFLIGLGGGSALDAMKAIAALSVNGGKITDYMGKEISGRMPSMTAIPTTAGTGSEATQFTIINDTRNHVKMLLKGRGLIPELAVIDPQFTLSAPPKITASTGMDAFTHAAEAYTSRKASKLSDTFALSALKRIVKYLPQAYLDGSNAEAREEMALAALEAGIAFNNASVTIIHGMSRPIGALFHVAHGLSNAMLLKECLTFALPGAYDRFGALGRDIGVADASDSDQEAAEKFLKAVEALVNELDTPTLEQFGINKEEFFNVIDKMAHDAMDSGSPQNTMRDVTEEEVKEIYRKLW